MVTCMLENIRVFLASLAETDFAKNLIFVLVPFVVFYIIIKFINSMSF